MNMQAIIQQMCNTNPLFNRAMQMSNGKSEQEIKQVANNLCEQLGVPIDKAFEEFKKQMPMFSNFDINI